MAGSIVLSRSRTRAAPRARGRRSAAVFAAAVAAACVAAGRAWCGAAAAGPGQRQGVLLRAQRPGSAAGAGLDKDTPQGVRMVLDEERRRGQTLESEFAQVLAARKLGRDIPRRGSSSKTWAGRAAQRKPGEGVKSNWQVSLEKAWRQAVGFTGIALAGGIEFADGPTLFWSTLIGLIVTSWCLNLFQY